MTGRRVRPAAYKTGTTQDNRDVHAYGYLAPPKNKSLHALVAGVWLGNSDNSPNDGKLSLDTSAPLWSAILSDVSKGMPISRFGRVRPKSLVTARVDPFTGARAAPGSQRAVTELFIRGTVPGNRTGSVTRTIDASTGLLWREGCVGPRVTRSYSGYANTEAGHPSVAPGELGVAGAGSPRPRRGGRPEGHPDRVLLRRRVLPLRPDVGWGRVCAGQGVPDRWGVGPERTGARGARRVPEAVTYRLNRISITSPSRTR